MSFPKQMRNQNLRDSLFVKNGHPEYVGKSLFWNRFFYSIGQPPVIDAIDSIRKITENGSVSVNRSEYKFVQTPQVFDGELLIKAYRKEFSENFTDDASVVEAMGAKMHLVTGNRENIKITTEMDLILANQLMK
jgi:2-C-methyl-D-erythritol 4-phosphate cytidylyltransferase